MSGDHRACEAAESLAGLDDEANGMGGWGLDASTLYDMNQVSTVLSTKVQLCTGPWSNGASPKMFWTLALIIRSKTLL